MLIANNSKIGNSIRDWIDPEDYAQESKDQQKTRALAFRDKERGVRGFQDYREAVEWNKLSRRERKELLQEQELEYAEEWPEEEYYEVPRTEYQPRPEFSMAQYETNQYSEDTLNRLYIRQKYGFEDDFDKE